jgi:hypothetical protein
MKLNSFRKSTVHHRPGTLRKIPFTGEMTMAAGAVQYFGRVGDILEVKA